MLDSIDAQTAVKEVSNRINALPRRTRIASKTFLDNNRDNGGHIYNNLCNTRIPPKNLKQLLYIMKVCEDPALVDEVSDEINAT